MKQKASRAVRNRRRDGARTTAPSKRLASAAALDRLHDTGTDLSTYMDLSTARRPGLAIRRVNADFPEWMIAELDRQARHLGVTRQSVIKVFIAERLESLAGATTAWGLADRSAATEAASTPPCRANGTGLPLKPHG